MQQFFYYSPSYNLQIILMYIEEKTKQILFVSIFMFLSASAEQFNSTQGNSYLGKNGAGGSAYFNDGVTDYTKAGIIIGSAFGLLFIVAGIVLCKIRRSGVPKWFPCHRFNKLKQSYNIVDTETFTIEEYKMQRDFLINLINDSVYQNTFYFQKEKEKNYQQIQAEIVNEEPFITELKINGKDQTHNWEAVGFILCRNKQIFFWIYKQYLNKDSSIKDPNRNHLVYESLKIDQDQVKGKWFYYGFQQIDDCTGFWYLQNKKKQNSVKSQSITNVKTHLRKDSSASRFTIVEHF